VRKHKECAGDFLSVKLRRSSARHALEPKYFKVDKAQEGYLDSSLERKNPIWFGR
jgi:hypothetical protein